MRRISLVSVCFLFGLTVCVLPANAAGKRANPGPTNWTQHDTAVYVVSTLNLVRLPKGGWLPAVLTGQYGVVRFDVFADVNTAQLFFVQLRRDDGSVVGSLAYRMGWSRPKSVSPLTDKLGVHRAYHSIVEAYKSHPKALIGSFTSTMPS